MPSLFRLPLLLILATSLICASCAPEKEPQTDQEQQLADDDGDEVSDQTRGDRIRDIVQTGRSLGATIDAITSNFGEPQDIVASDTINPHTGDSDRVVRLKYPEMEFELYQTRDGDRELLMETVLMGERAAEALPEEMRRSRDGITSYLGEPWQTTSPDDSTTIVRYETLDVGAPDILSFYLVDGEIRKVTWGYYVD
jgi:hypothetical protein